MSNSPPSKRGVLMVCLGNTCRSPIAEEAFRQEVEARGLSDKWFVDSAATMGYHTGKLPDRRAREVMSGHGIDMKHRARTLCEDDFKKFDFIIGMDDSNIDDIEHMKPSDSKSVIEMFAKYDTKNSNHIHDPYYDPDSSGFHECYERCVRCSRRFLDVHG